MLNCIVEIELNICIKMVFALNNLQSWYALKPSQPTNQPTSQTHIVLWYLRSLLWITCVDSIMSVRVCLCKSLLKNHYSPFESPFFSRTHSVTVIDADFQRFWETITWRQQAQSWQQASNNTGILNNCTRFANGTGNRGSIPGRHTKDSKNGIWCCLNTQHYIGKDQGSSGVIQGMG